MTAQIDYSKLKANYASSYPAHPSYVSQKDLFESIGWDAYVGDTNYANTCAIRLSLALIKSGHTLSSGSHKVLDGPHKGARVEVRMSRLAEKLASNAWLGQPEILSAPNVASAVGARQGIIAFHGIPGYAGGGHIDLIDNDAASLRCASGCYFHADETWFWPLLKGLVG
ncbi:type VI secretion system amidase effector protein Tae4 [Paracoccaceae bacterium GXU_MW_L88]